MGDIIPNQVTFKFHKRTNNTESSQNIMYEDPSGTSMRKPHGTA